MNKTQARKLCAPKSPDNPLGLMVTKGKKYEALLVLLNGHYNRNRWPAEDPIEFEMVSMPTEFDAANRCWCAHWEYYHDTFSIYKSGKPRHIENAARYHVEDQIAPLRQSGCDVHHTPEFSDLLNAWRGEEDIECEEVEGHPFWRRFKCSEKAKDWAEYHRRNATLEVITKEEHKRRHGAA